MLFYVATLIILGGLAVGAIRTSYRIANAEQVSRAEWARHWYADFSSELTGAFLAALLFGLVLFVIQQNQTEADIKQQLIRQMGSSVNSEAVRAAEELGQRGWLYDGSLKNAHLIGANLQGAKLGFASLQEADLRWANLKGTNLFEANLQGVDFTNAQFDQQTLLPDGKFREADTDISRFTDPNRPDFWRSDDPSSPAYRDKNSGG
jgi:hypothetical protein